MLAELIHLLPTSDPQLLVGPSVGEDAAVIQLMPGQPDAPLLVAKSDPITFATDEIGYYAVNVCANDLAVMGAQPRFYLPTLLLPAALATEALARDLFAQIGQACRALDIVVAGGHSEITPTVQQPVICGAMLGVAPAAGYVRSDGCQVGDLLLLAGTVPVEGASIIAREMRAELRKRGWSAERLDEAANYLHAPGISVLKPALAAARVGLVHAMHDPTEGGIASGLLELALAANVGLEIDLDAISVPALARDLCAEFELDPLGTIASGALLAAAAPAQAAPLQQLWQELGWPSAIIGRTTASPQQLHAHRAGMAVPFPRFAVDEITRLFE
ncbi:MAG: AIR synthase-related protein [Caldilineaceae bacterium]